MGKTTGISWTDATYNPWYGCLKVSPGCKQCYMYRDMERYGRNPMVVTKAKPFTFNAPLKWTEPQRVFTCSWSDFFIEQADGWRDEAWDIIRRTPHLTFQILTKRPENIAYRLPKDWGEGWPNVWIGVSIESPKYLWRTRQLAEIPAIIRFISYEPALEEVDFAPVFITGKYQWLISGGESGYNPRPANIDWFRAARRDCQDYRVAYFLKQLGGSRKIDGDWGGRLLDGIEWNQFPEVTEPVVTSQDLEGQPIQGILL